MRTKLLNLPLLFLLLTSLAAPVPAQAGPAKADAPSLNVVSQMGGVTNVVVYSSGQLYTNVGPRIVRMAVSSSDPGAPALPASYGSLLPGTPEDMKLANGYLYVALGAGGVAVVDPTTLGPLSTQALPNAGFAAAVAVGSQRLYVAAGSLGIVAYDLGADKKTLAYGQAKTFSPEAFVTDVVTRLVTVGNVTTESLFASANDSDPAAPSEAGGVFKFDITSSPVLGTPTKVSEPMAVNALEVTDDYVYAAGQFTFFVLDAAELGNAGGVSSMVPLSVPALNLGMGPDDDIVYLMSAAGIDMVDVTTPTEAFMENDLPFATQGVVEDVAAVNFPGEMGTYLYLADGGAGLSILSDPFASEGSLGVDDLSYLEPKPADTHLVTVGNGQAFVFSNAEDLWTTTAAATPSLMGVGITPTTWAKSMMTYSNLLLMSAGPDGLLRFEMDASGDPTGLTSFIIDPNDYAYEAALAWPNVAVADGANGLAMVDLATMSVLVRTAPTAASDFQMVEVEGNYAYIIDTMDNAATPQAPVFRIYDISDAAHPVLKGTWSTDGLCGTAGLTLDMEESDARVFLACGDAGVKVVDVSDPTAAVLLGSAGYDTPGQAQGLAVYDDKLYVADGEAGVEQLTIQPSGALSLAASAKVSGNALQVAPGAGGQVFVATGASGLVVLQATGPFQVFLPIVRR